VGLLSDIEDRAKKSLRAAQKRHTTAKTMEQWRLETVIRERQRTLEIIQTIRLALKYGTLTRDDVIGTSGKEAEHG
jgi:hypothetical protein